MTAGPFRALLLDPPWNETGGGRIRRGADRHYGLLKTKDMPGVIRGSGLWNLAENAHLYCWVTNNFLEDGLWLMKELGFTYVTNLVWVKVKQHPLEDVAVLVGLIAAGRLGEAVHLLLRFGIGRYFRGGHEILLFGVKGNGCDESVMQEARNIGSVLADNRGAGHSVKPVGMYAKIEARSKGPYLEMFARSARAGWISWGNEVGAAEPEEEEASAESAAATTPAPATPTIRAASAFLARLHGR